MKKPSIKLKNEEVIDQDATRDLAVKFRVKNNLKMSQVASKMGRPVSLVSYLESGKRNWTHETFSEYVNAVEELSK